MSALTCYHQMRVTSDKPTYEDLLCSCKVEMSGFCKVEMSKLPFRQTAEAQIGISDDEWNRVAAH